MPHGQRYATGERIPPDLLETNVSDTGDPILENQIKYVFQRDKYGCPLNKNGDISGSRPHEFYRHKRPHRT